MRFSKIIVFSLFNNLLHVNTMVESGWVVLGKNIYKNWKTNAADNDNLNDAGDSFKNQNADKTLINKMLTF